MAVNTVHLSTVSSKEDWITKMNKVKPCRVVAEGSQISRCVPTTETLILNYATKTRVWALGFFGHERAFAAAFTQKQDYQILPYYRKLGLEKTWATSDSSHFHPYLDYNFFLKKSPKSYKARLRKKKIMYLCKHTAGPWFQRIHGYWVHQWIP